MVPWQDVNLQPALAVNWLRRDMPLPGSQQVEMGTADIFKEMIVVGLMGDARPPRNDETTMFKPIGKAQNAKWPC